MFVYPWYISDLTVTKDIRNIVGTAVKEAFVHIDHDTLILYYDAPSLNLAGKSLLHKILNNESFFDRAVNKIYTKSGLLISYCRKNTAGSQKTVSNVELIRIFYGYISKLRELRAWGWVPVLLEGFDTSYLTEYLQKNLQEFLQNKKIKADAAKIYSVLSSSEKTSEVQKEELARLQMIGVISRTIKANKLFKIIGDNDFNRIEKQYPLIGKLVNNHLKKFGWLTYAYSGPAMQPEYLLGMIKDNLNRGGIAQQKSAVLDHYKKIKKEKKKIIGELKLPRELIRLFKISAELMYIKDYRKGIYQESYVLMDAVLNEIASRLGLTLKAVKYLLAEEIGDALRGKIKKEKLTETVTERQRICCYRVKDGKITVRQGQECLAMLKKLSTATEIKKEKSGEIKGTVAYAGKVSGTVKVVLTVADIEKVKEGDILVSSSTNPDLIIAMKKAAAFVTETGGIISHAAIVSREMRKPCIVGTKNATHVLKDGDRVEVDANQGIVTIL